LREVALTIPMKPDAEIAASKTATSMAESMPMNPDRIEEVGQAVVEACINAFEHSHSPDRQVYMTVEVLGDTEPEMLRITVRDTGVGFAPESVEEPSLEQKLKSPRKRGWGLKIIRELMDEVDIHSGANGTTVVMCKAREDGMETGTR
jgi:serine/threonine-protein kinase RsbW